jgi:DNA-binding response OmpR family regulator
VRSAKLDLIILDIDVPDENRFKTLSALRTRSRVPMVVLAARAREDDMLAAFREGADDYLGKPINAQVLLSRIKAILRRANPHCEQSSGVDRTYCVHGVVFDPGRNEISSSGVCVRLTRMESGILRELLIHEGQVLLAERLIERVAGYTDECSRNVLRAHIHNLRQKIGSLPGSRLLIHTVPNVGYILCTPEHTAKLFSLLPVARARRTSDTGRGQTGSHERPRGGRKPRLTEAERRAVIALATTLPDHATRHMGDASAAQDRQGNASWTLDTLTAAARACGIAIARSQVRRILMAEGLRWW